MDGSEGSRQALDWAFEEAKVHTSLVEAVTVWRSAYDAPRDFDVSYQVADETLAQRARRLLAGALAPVADAHPNVKVESAVLEGDPAEVLCRRAAGADVLVVGSRGHGTFAGLLLGSVSSKCAHHSAVPVVIVPARPRGHSASDGTGGTDGTGATGRVVVGVDGSSGSLRALEWALGECDARGATAVALMAWRGFEADAIAADALISEVTTSPTLTLYDRGTAEDAAQRLERAVAQARGAQGAQGGRVTVEQLAVEGEPAEVLCQHAADADLLVVGSRGRGTFTELALGSVSAKCARHSPRPVVIVPAKRAGP